MRSSTRLGLMKGSLSGLYQGGFLNSFASSSVMLQRSRAEPLGMFSRTAVARSTPNCSRPRCRFEDSFGDEKHAGAGFEGLDGGLEGEMGEEAEGHGDVSEDAGAVAVAKDGGLAAGVDVGEDAEREVVAAEEGGGEAGAAGGFVDGLVDLVREDPEGVHHVDDFGGEELGDAAAKGVLGGGGDGVGRVACAGDVGEEEDDVGSGGDGVEEVATGAGGVVARVEVELFEWRQRGGQRRAGELGRVLHGWWRLYFV